jgi:hypothetical protein
MGAAKKYKTKIKDGQGVGEGIDYTPWYEGTEYVPKTGIYTSPEEREKKLGNNGRKKGITIPRIHHLLSSYEIFLFTVFDLNPKIIDIREQFPLLKLEAVSDIFKYFNIKQRQSEEPHVLTTDFLIRLKDRSELAVTFKPTEFLSKRQMQLFQVEKEYWNRNGIDWKLCTEKELPRSKSYIKNINALHNSLVLLRDEPISFYTINAIYSFVSEFSNSLRNHTLLETAQIIDEDLSIDTGTSIMVFKVLIAKGIFQLDLNQNIFSENVQISQIKILKNGTLSKSDIAA